jgi:hypothetical protein
MFSNDLIYKVFEDYNIPFDEHGSTVGTVRKVQWVKKDKEPDESKAKIEIRKMYINSEGERSGKGYTFSTPEGPNELINGMIRAGFGNTKDILNSIRIRSDFKNAIETIDDDEDNKTNGEAFDMRDLLIGLYDENDEDELDDAI